MLDDLRGECSLVGHAHISSEGGVRHPLAGVARGGLLEHAVDLLERQALGFGNEEVAVHQADGAERAPDEEDLGAQVALGRADHVGGDDCDDLGIVSKGSEDG